MPKRHHSTGLRKMFANQQYIMNNEQYLSSPRKWGIAVQMVQLLFFNCSWINKMYFLQPICNIPLGNTFYYHFGCILVNKFVAFEHKCLASNPRYKFIKNCNSS